MTNNTIKDKKILVTGGAGFVGSHVAEYYARKDCEIIVIDNLSRTKLLGKNEKNARYNWDYLKKFHNIKLFDKDISDFKQIKDIIKDVDVIFHIAAQTAVTASVSDPSSDFSSNAIGTFNILEAARINDIKKIIYCSTNKVYGNNVNKIKVIEGEKRYKFEDKFKGGINENFPIDHCEHTPYGCSKLTGDLYVQDYAHSYGIKTGVFRMSCIYGTRQFGVEDQGWVAWFTIATLLNKPITIYGNGKQVRDVLYIRDLLEIYDKFINSNLKMGVFNTGGGIKNTLSLLELLDILKELTGKKSKITYGNWRPSDQKVYISNIQEAYEKLGWEPKIAPIEGIKKLVEWVEENKKSF